MEPDSEYQDYGHHWDVDRVSLQFQTGDQLSAGGGEAPVSTALNIRDWEILRIIRKTSSTPLSGLLHHQNIILQYSTKRITILV